MLGRELKELINSLPGEALDKEVIMHVETGLGVTYTTPTNVYILALDQYFPFGDMSCGMKNEEDLNSLHPDDKAAGNYKKVFDKHQVVIYSDKLALREPEDEQPIMKRA